MAKRLRGAASPTSPRRVRAEERNRRILEMRIAGMTLTDISRQVGVSVETARRAILRYLQRVPYEQIEELRRLELARLDVATMLAMRKIAEGDLTAIDRLVRIIDLRMRITGGYFVHTVPVSGPIQLVWPDGSPVEIPPAGPELTE